MSDRLKPAFTTVLFGVGLALAFLLPSGALASKPSACPGNSCHSTSTSSTTDTTTTTAATTTTATTTTAAAATTATTTTAATTNSSPWTNVVNDQFGSGGVPAHWSVYNFANSQAGHGYYLASHVTAPGDGYLHLLNKYESSGPAGAGWYQGAFSLTPTLASVDQRITYRARVIETGGGNAAAHRNMPLRWPVSGRWPADGEEDFYESDPTYTTPWAFFHYGSTNQFLYHQYPGIDLSQWHTFRVQRQNYVITVWIDDMVNPVYVYSGNSTTLPPTLK
jgi:hypothetical protein